MRKSMLAFALATVLAPMAVGADATDDEDSQAAKWARLAKQTKPEPCPTEIEVLPYIWIEPSTGAEYTALRLHCPGRDDSDDDPVSGPGLPDERVPGTVRSAS